MFCRYLYSTLSGPKIQMKAQGFQMTQVALSPRIMANAAAPQLNFVVCSTSSILNIGLAPASVDLISMLKLQSHSAAELLYDDCVAGLRSDQASRT
jgi:hypothetical protein